MQLEIFTEKVELGDFHRWKIIRFRSPDRQTAHSPSFVLVIWRRGVPAEIRRNIEWCIMDGEPLILRPTGLERELWFRRGDYNAVCWQAEFSFLFSWRFDIRKWRNGLSSIQVTVLLYVWRTPIETVTLPSTNKVVETSRLLRTEDDGRSARMVQNGRLPRLKIGTKNQKCLENLKPAAYFL